MRVSIVGWYGMKNVGDEAFHYVLGEFFKGHEVEFVTPPRRCNSPDIVVLGGGAVASPFYLDTLPDCPRYALGIDLAYESEADLLAKANFKEIYVRTKTDADALSKKVSCPVAAIPDLAFYITPSWKNVLGWLRERKGPERPAIGVFATDYVLPALDRPVERFQNRAISFSLGLAAELDKLAHDGYEIVLVPCSTDGYGNDNRVNLDVAAHMKTEPTVLLDTISPQEMIALMNCMDANICMRFHAHLFSVMAQKPFVSIQFTRKVDLFLKEHNLSHLTAVKSNDSCFYWGDLREKLKAAKLAHDGGEFRSLAESYRQQLREIRTRVRQDWLGEAV